MEAQRTCRARNIREVKSIIFAWTAISMSILVFGTIYGFYALEASPTYS